MITSDMRHGTAFDPSHAVVVYAWSPLVALDETSVRRSRRRCLANLSRVVRTTRVLGGARPVGEVLDIEARAHDDFIVMGERPPDTSYVLVAAARLTARVPRAAR